MSHNMEGISNMQPALPSREVLDAELSRAETLEDFFGRDGLLAQLFARAVETILEGELTAQLGYDRYESKGRNSGNNRNGSYSRTVRTSMGDAEIQRPRDRQGAFQPKLLEKHQKSSQEIEAKVLALYAKGMSTRDIEDLLGDIYGVEVSAATISTITDQVWPEVEAWQNRPLAAVYPIVFLDAIFVKMRRNHRVESVAVYTALAIGLDGYREVLGHWVGDSEGEGAHFWLGVLSDLQARGVEDIFIACVDGLSGFSEAIHAIFPRTAVQRCIIHQIRTSLNYVPWKERKALVADLKTVYQAPTREEAERQLQRLDREWGERFPMAVRTWHSHWEELATLFDYPPHIRRIIYTTNTVESYHRQLRKVLKTKGALPSPKAARKLLFLVHKDATKRWTMPIRHWTPALNQLAIYFDGRFPI